ncbi:MAG: peptidoglycan-binding protein LysM [Pseudomonadota bacterium]
MGVFDFVKSAGEMLFGKDEDPKAEAVKEELEKHALDVEGVEIEVEGDTVKIKGSAASQEAREKAILAVGNIAGVAKVEDALETAEAGAEAVFHTVEKGDTLWAIATAHLGDGNKYPEIFEANKPMLTHPDKIYPGQVLRIPRA